MEKEKEGETERRLKIAVKLLLSSFLLTNFLEITCRFPASYLRSPLIENDLDVEDFAKLLENKKKKEKMNRLNKGCKSCAASRHGVSALFNHDELAPSQLC